MESSSIQRENDETCIRGVLSAVPHAVVWIEAHGSVAYLNPAAEMLFCLRWEEAFGLDLDALLGRRVDANRDACPVLSCVRAGADYHREAERVVSAEGRELSVALTARALLLRGAFRGAVILVRELGRPGPLIRLCPVAVP